MSTTKKIDGFELETLAAVNASDPTGRVWTPCYELRYDRNLQGTESALPYLPAARDIPRIVASLRKLDSARLLEGEPGVRGLDRGYRLTGKGLAALESAVESGDADVERPTA